jgi:uncharacterized repeat protein (TIGR01451 family)
MQYHLLKSGYRFILCFCLMLFSFTGGVFAKSLYVIADINASPTPIRTYDIQGAPTHLVFQAVQGVPAFAGGAVGLAIDTDAKKLFVTYEVSNTIQLLDATNFANLGTTVAPGASNLAGIVIDQAKKKLYTVDRETNHLYVYSWDAATNTLTLDGGAFKTLPLVSLANGIALDESRGRLYIGDRATSTVRYYDTTTWQHAGSYVQAVSAQTAMGVAVDTKRNFVYTGNAYQPYGSKGMLVKYDLNTNTESSYTLPGAQPASASGDNIVGLAVDEETGNVYATTGNQGSGGTDSLIVFDSNLAVLKNDLGDIGNPTGIAIPRASVSFNPLNFSKTDNVDPVASGANITYKICYDNLANTGAASSVTITDAVPPGTTFVSATGPFALAAGVVTWTVGTVAGGAASVCYDLVVNVTAPAGSQILNLATINGVFGEVQIPTTQSQTTDVAGGFQPMNLFVEDSTDPVETGKPLTYSICYDNSRNTATETGLSNVVLTSGVPAGATFVSATGNPIRAGSVLTWNIGAVPDNAPRTCFDVNLIVTAAPGTQVIGSATIRSDQTAPLTQEHPTDVIAAAAQAVTIEGVGEAGGGAMGWVELLLGVVGLAAVHWRRLAHAARPLMLAASMVAALAAASPRSAEAAGPGWYLGAGAGQSVGNASAGDLDRQLSSLGYTTASTMDDKGGAWKVFGGYRFTPIWAAEASYVKLGKVTSTIRPNPAPASVAQLLSDVTKVHPYSLSGATLSGVATLPLPNGFSAFAKLGVIRWDGDVRAHVAPAGTPNALQNYKGTDLSYGLGLGFDFPTNPWGFRLEWESFKTNRNDPYMISASVVYRF